MSRPSRTRRATRAPVPADRPRRAARASAAPASSKGELTRAHIQRTALELFRREGFEATTMRGIAEAAGLSLGAAYHYFESKEAILIAYYEQLQEAHERRFATPSAWAGTLEERLRAALRTKLEVTARDRRLLGALMRGLGDPTHPLAIFGSRTRDVRERSIALFRSALEGPDLPALRPELADAAGRGLWLLHLGILLYFVADRSRGQQRSYQLVDGVARLLAGLLPWLGEEAFAPVLAQLQELLAEAGLLPTN